MSDAIYPRALEVKKEDPIDLPSAAEEIIQLMEEGASANYFGNGDADIGKPLGECHITGIAAHGKNSPKTILALYRSIKKEGADAKAISPAKYATETTYKEALNEVMTYLDADIWVEGMKLQAGVTKWEELKDKYTVAEEMEK